MDTSKKALREKAAALRKELARNDQLHARLSEKLQQTLIDTPEWADAEIICSYSPIRGEAGTSRINESALKEGKILLLPVCRKNEPGIMDLCRVRDLTDLVPGSFGILEPSEICERYTMEQVAALNVLFAVPGLAFDRRGYRLGYGSGFYDRYLSALPKRFAVGLIFDELIFDELPADEWDQPMDALACPSGLIRMHE